MRNHKIISFIIILVLMGFLYINFYYEFNMFEVIKEFFKPKSNVKIIKYPLTLQILFYVLFQTIIFLIFWFISWAFLIAYVFNLYNDKEFYFFKGEQIFLFLFLLVVGLCVVWLRFYYLGHHIQYIHWI